MVHGGGVLDGEEARLPVGEVGEIAIRGHNVMKGYWGKPEAIAEAIPDGCSVPATWPRSMTTATSTSWAARRT